MLTRTQRGNFLAALFNLVHPQYKATLTASTHSPEMPPADLARPGFDSHWQTGPNHWDVHTDARLRVDWASPVTLDFLALAGIAFRGFDPMQLQWHIEISENGRDFPHVYELPFVVRTPWGSQKWGDPGLWLGGPSAQELAVIAADLRFHTGFHLPEPVRARAVRLIFPRPRVFEPGAYLRAAELWIAKAWQTEANIQWGTGVQPTSLATVSPSPDGWNFGTPGRQLRGLSTEWDSVTDDEFWRQIHTWWLQDGPASRAFIVPSPEKPGLWHHQAMVARPSSFSGDVAGFLNNDSDRNELSVTWEESFG